MDCIHYSCKYLLFLENQKKNRDFDDLAGNRIKRALFKEDELIDTGKNREISPNCGQGLTQTLS